VVVVSLVKENVFAVFHSVIIGSELLKHTIRTDTVLATQLLPELGTD
jgi:hypothetical protein